MPKARSNRNLKITTIKLKKETKERLNHLKEFEKESYDEIIKKILYILNTLRSSAESAQSVLRAIDSKLKRKERVYLSIPQENLENLKMRESSEQKFKPQVSMNIKTNQKPILRKK